MREPVLTNRTQHVAVTGMAEVPTELANSDADESDLLKATPLMAKKGGV